METRGVLHAVNPAEQVTPRYRKREFVLMLDPDGRYPQTVLFQLSNDRVGLVDDFDPGDELRVEFSLRGREWTSPKGETRYFNSLEVWEIEGVGGSAGPRQLDEPAPEDDDIPF